MPDNVKAPNIKDILEDRGKNYGAFEGHAIITQKLKDVCRETPNWEKLNSVEKEAIEMTMHKLGRILNGNPHFLDSWVDIVGYNQLVVDNLLF